MENVTLILLAAMLSVPLPQLDMLCKHMPQLNIQKKLNKTKRNDDPLVVMTQPA